MRKRVLPVLFAVLCFFSSCSKRETGHSAGGKKVILATFYPLYIMLMNITEAVPDVQLAMLAPADTGCLHDYQLTTKDMQTLEACDILVMNGAGMEDFLDKALEAKKERAIVAAEGFALFDGNSHVWVSPQGAAWQVRRITDGLCELDKDNAALYKANGEAYIAKLNRLSDDMHSRLDKFAGSRIITFHEAFPYFASEFNLELAAVIEREAGTEPSAKEMAELVLLIKDAVSSGGKVALFAEPQYSSAAAEIISRETGLAVAELDPAVTGVMDKDAYLDAMEKNTQVLEKQLGGVWNGVSCW